MSTPADNPKDPNQDLIDKFARMKLQKQIDELEAPPKPENTELKLLENSAGIIAQQKAIVEGQKAIAEAQKATIETAFPKGALPTLEGDIKVDDKFGYAAVPVAYQAIKENIIFLTKAIEESRMQLVKDAETANKERKVRILIVNELDFTSSDIPVIQMDSGIGFLNERIKKQKEENLAILKPKKKAEEAVKAKKGLAAAEVGGVVSGVLSTISDIIGYFQVNYEIKGQIFKIETEALQAIVASRIAKDFEVLINNFAIIEKSELIESFNDLLNAKGEIDEDIKKMSKFKEPLSEELKKTKEDLDKLEVSSKKEDKHQLDDPKTEENNTESKKKLNEHIQELNNKINPIETATSNSQDLVKSIVAFAESVTKSTDEKTLPLLAKAAVRKQIHTLGITHLLYLKILSSGGEAMTLKSRLTSGETAFIGGAVLSFVLATTKGVVRASDVFPVLSQLNYNLSDNDERFYQGVSLARKKRSMGRFKRFVKWLDGSKTEEIKEDTTASETKKTLPAPPPTESAE